MKHRVLTLALWMIAAATRAGEANDGLSVIRTMMPDAGPSAFAVGLPGNIGFCYDPGRGEINYLWLGQFVDLQPTWSAKINRPASVRGRIVYRESTHWPLRLNGDEREPRYEFRGYLLLPEAVEFHYHLGDVLVREEIKPCDDGQGLIRRFRLNEPCSKWQLSLEPQPGVVISSLEGKWDARQKALIGGADREFTIQLRWQTEPKK